jgi:hypothetical protein
LPKQSGATFPELQKPLTRLVPWRVFLLNRMKLRRHYLLGLVMLALYFTSGQLVPCVEAMERSHSACENHDHRDADPREEHSCECPTCHQCGHIVFVITAPEILVCASGEQFTSRHSIDSLPRPASEIFTPPKLS